MILKFTGKVELGDGYRISNEYKSGAIFIGNIDVVSEIDDIFKDGTKLIIGIADKTFNGDLFVECGWGYSEYTPMDSDTLKVGDHDLINILEGYEDEEITMWVSNEPINILEGEK